MAEDIIRPPGLNIYLSRALDKGLWEKIKAVESPKMEPIQSLIK